MVAIIAHRGFSGVYPENTLLAFRQAIDLGVDAIEFDVKATKDGVICLLHDFTVDRTSDGHGAIAEMTWREITALDAGTWKGAKFAGNRIPTFEQALDTIPPAIEINIHALGVDHVTHSIVTALQQKGRIENVYLATQASQITLARTLCPQLRVCNMSPQRDPDYLDRSVQVQSDLVQFFAQDLTPGLVERAHAHGIKVNVFYANDVPTTNQFIKWGVDAILTDYPDVLLAALAGQ